MTDALERIGVATLEFVVLGVFWGLACAAVADSKISLCCRQKKWFRLCFGDASFFIGSMLFFWFYDVELLSSITRQGEDRLDLPTFLGNMCSKDRDVGELSMSAANAVFQGLVGIGVAKAAMEGLRKIGVRDDRPDEYREHDAGCPRKNEHS